MDREINKKIGEAIAYARRTNGLTQHDLAELTNTNRTHIAKIERGHMDVTLWKVEELLNAMGYRLAIAKNS